MNYDVVKYGAAAVTVVAFLYILGTMSWGFLPSASASANMAGILPGLLIVFLGMATAGEVKRSPAVIGAMGALGLGLALLISELEAEGVIVAGSFGTWTVYNVQFMCIVCGLLLGGIIYFRR